MAATILGIFSDRDQVSNAIDDLKDKGYDAKDISIVMKDAKEGKEIADDTGADVAGGAVSGATTGAVLGGLAGLIASFVIPGLGVFFVGGPIAAALGLTGAAASTVSGAATGALAGGLLGALMGFGLSEDDAREYETHINEGGILVAVPVKDSQRQEVKDILSTYGVSQLRSVSNNIEEEFTPARTQRNSQDQYAYAGAKGGKTTNKPNESSKGRGWHGDPKGHSIAGKGEDVPNKE
jgi:uncharacterized membrane protein